MSGWKHVGRPLAVAAGMIVIAVLIFSSMPEPQQTDPAIDPKFARLFAEAREEYRKAQTEPERRDAVEPFLDHYIDTLVDGTEFDSEFYRQRLLKSAYAAFDGED